MGISAKLVTESETIPDPCSLKSDWTIHTGSGLTYCLFSGGKHHLVFSTSVWSFFDFLAPLSHVDFSEVFAEDIVVMQILRKQDPIQSVQDLLRNELNMFGWAS